MNNTLLVAATAALLTTAQFAEAAKVDPAIVSAVAAAATTDIEAIVNIAVTQGNAIASGAIKINTGNINALAAGLSAAVAGKTGADPVNSLVNRVDELGETAAFLAHSITGNKKSTKLKTAKQFFIALLKSSLASTVSLSPQVVSDVAGSVALTLHNDSRLDAIETKLSKALIKGAKKINKTNSAAVATALAAGFLGDAAANAKFEDGNIATLASVADPETDNRNG